EVLEDLRAEPNLAPLPRARNLGAGRGRLRNGMRRHARRAVAQKDDDAAALVLEALQCRVHRMGAAEDIADDVGAMQPRQHVAAVADTTMDEGHVLDRVEWGDIGGALQRTNP